MYSCKALVTNLAPFGCKVLIINLINPLHAGFAFSFPFLDSKIMFGKKCKLSFFLCFREAFQKSPDVLLSLRE